MEIRMRSQCGLTLVELLVVVVIGSMVLGSVLSLFDTNHKIYLQQDELSRMQQEIRSVLGQLAGDIRMGAFDPTQAGSKVFGFKEFGSIDAQGRSSNDTAIYLTSDLNRDGMLNNNGTGSTDEHIAYYLDPPSQTLFRFDSNSSNAAPNKWEIAATNIQDIQFSYLDKDGNATVNVDDIRCVEVTVVAAASAARSHLKVSDRSMSTRIQCRNRQL